MRKGRFFRARFKSSGPSPLALLSSSRSALSVRQKLVLGAGAIGIFSILVFNGAFRTIILGNLELRRLNAEMSALENEQAALSSQIASLRSNDAALERAVRRELGFLRPGEIEYRFPPPSPDDRNR